jgi:PAS domain S-box-containing protein
MPCPCYFINVGWEVRTPQLLQRIERARRVVSLCSQAIIRAYDEEALLFEECRILLDVGGYAMAWVGEIKTGATAMVPLAHAGTEPSGVRNVDPPWVNDMGPHSPTGRAIREQRPQVLRGILTNPALQQRQPEAEALGYAAVCAFPLQFGPHGTGALAVYAHEPDAFAPEEVALLRELAGDLGAGVAVLRAKHASELLEEQLEAAERRYRSLIEHAPIAVVQINLDGKVLIANEALAKLLGYASPAEVMAQTPAELAHHLEDADVERIERLIRSGPPFKPLELRVRRRDGTLVWVDVQAQPGIGIDERVIEAFVRDLTAARAAQLTGSRLAAIVDASEEAIIGIDPEGIVQAWSRGATALYGYSEGEALGRPLADLYVPEDRRAEWQALLVTLAKGERVHRFDTRRLCKRKEPKEVSVAASPILDADGRVVGASLIEHDVEERNRLQSARLAQERQQQEVFHLQALARMRSEFMSRASHELNTPLTPVLLQIQSLKEIPGLDAKQALGLASIERNVMRLAVLVKDLLSASSLTSSQLDLAPIEVDLADLAATAVESFRAQARGKGVTLVDASTEGVAAFADRDRVMQVLFNLLDNAIKFTPAQGSVTVQATERDGAAAVTVTDTGLGFAAEARANLFRPFGRLHEEVPGAPLGTGLGLFISKGIIEGSGGHIWADSPGPGKGTTVGFTLPLRPAQPGRGIRSAKGFAAPPAEAPTPGPPVPAVPAAAPPEAPPAEGKE